MTNINDVPTIVITFPRPVSANRMFMRQMTRHGRRDLTPEYKEWRDRAGWLVRMQIVGMEMITTPFDVVIEMPRSRMDLDNGLKPILDLAQNLEIISNDKNANQITISQADRSDCMAAFWPRPDLGVAEAAAKRRTSKNTPKREGPKKPGLSWKF